MWNFTLNATAVSSLRCVGGGYWYGAMSLKARTGGAWGGRKEGSYATTNVRELVWFVQVAGFSTHDFSR